MCVCISTCKKPNEYLQFLNYKLYEANKHVMHLVLMISKYHLPWSENSDKKGTESQGPSEYDLASHCRAMRFSIPLAFSRLAAPDTGVAPTDCPPAPARFSCAFGSLESTTSTSSSSSSDLLPPLCNCFCWLKKFCMAVSGSMPLPPDEANMRTGALLRTELCRKSLNAHRVGVYTRFAGRCSFVCGWELTTSDV